MKFCKRRSVSDSCMCVLCCAVFGANACSGIQQHKARMKRLKFNILVYHLPKHIMPPHSLEFVLNLSVCFVSTVRNNSALRS